MSEEIAERLQALVIGCKCSGDTKQVIVTCPNFKTCKLAKDAALFIASLEREKIKANRDLSALLDAINPKGPRCRDCADFDGRCQGNGDLCDPQERALERVAHLRIAEVEVKRLRAREFVLTEAHSIASAVNRSIWQVAERNGEKTNWDSLRSGIMRALETSHEALNTLQAAGNPTTSKWVDPDDCEENP